MTKANTAQKGVIKVNKTGEVFSTVTENGGVYQPVYTVQGLPGAVFEITAAEDVYTTDGTLRYSAGDVVDTLTTGATGTAESKPLYLGRFEIREVTAPSGMVASKEVHSVELTYCALWRCWTTNGTLSANNNFSAVIPYDMELQRKESKEFLDDLTTRDQRMMQAVLTMVITADTKEQLDADTDAIRSLSGQQMCQMAVLKYQQLDGLNTVLPIGVRKINTYSTKAVNMKWALCCQSASQRLKSFFSVLSRWL